MSTLTPDRLFDYQKKAVNFQSTRPQSMLWLEMGLGKTAITLTTVSHLIKTGFLRSVVIVAPIRVCRLVWRQEAAKWDHTKHLTFSLVVGTKDQRTQALMRPANIYLVNYENLKWLSQTLHTYFISAKTPKPIPFNGIVWDECFVEGTLIQTPVSHIAIDKLKIGDMVMTHLGPRRVINTMCKVVYDLIEVKLSSGVVLRCTPNHPFRVGDDWVRAEHLKDGDLLHHEEPQHQKIRRGVLSDMRDRVLEASGRAVYLLKGMRQYMADAATRGKKSNHLWRHQGPSTTPGFTWGVEQRKTLVRRDASKDEHISQGSRSLSPDRRERDRRIVGRESFENDSTRQLQTGVHFSGNQEVGRGLSNSLQDRLCGRSEQDSDRSTGSITQHNSGENARREETQALRGTRVDSVIRHKSAGGECVWNIHVEEAETYYAGGVLVHNCSKMKNSATDRVRAFRRIENHFDWTTGLTGTPASNGYKDLHGQYLVVDRGVRLGESKTKFKTKFYHKVDISNPHSKEIPFPDSEETIKHLIGDITLEMSAEDYNPLPDLIVNDVEVDMTGELRAKYDKLEKELFVQLDSGTEIEVFNQASLTNKCLQFSNGAVYPVPGLPVFEEVHDLKLDALEEIIDEAQGKPILCAYSYRSDAERIMERFKALKPINLTECKSERALQNAMERWKRGDCPLMIGHPASMGHGVDGLQDAGRTLVWFGLTWSLDLYEQFNARIRRQGQGASVVCHRILVSNTLDDAQRLRLVEKDATQAGLKRAVKAYRQSKGSDGH